MPGDPPRPPAGGPEAPSPEVAPEEPREVGPAPVPAPAPEPQRPEAEEPEEPPAERTESIPPPGREERPPPQTAKSGGLLDRLRGLFKRGQ